MFSCTQRWQYGLDMRRVSSLRASQLSIRCVASQLAVCGSREPLSKSRYFPDTYLQQDTLFLYYELLIFCTVKLELVTTCIQRPPLFKDPKCGCKGGASLLFKFSLVALGRILAQRVASYTALKVNSLPNDTNEVQSTQQWLNNASIKASVSS